MPSLRETLPRDALAALAVTVLSIPQSVAYAMIAGLPPAAGLYASTIPAIVGSLTRSSRFVVTGPSNALSLLMGAAVGGLSAATGAGPVEIATTAALMVGVLQLGAGLLRLGVLVDYISSPVVLGYITGAGVLIGVGQLPNVSGTPMDPGVLPARLLSWAQGLGATEPLTIALALGTLGVLLLMRRIDRRIPGAVVVMVLGIAGSLLFDFQDRGLRVVADLEPIKAQLPPLTLPNLGLLSALFPLALAASVLSLVESTSVARTLAAARGDRLDNNREFVGQGLANVTAALTGGYPISGSLSRSALNERIGAQTRFSGMLAGALVLVAILVAGPVLDHTPIAVLAGLLLLVAWDLIDRVRISRTLRATWGDRSAFLVTMLATWVVDLDKAILLGVAISIALFLRRARMLTSRELVVNRRNRLRESSGDDDPGRRCRHVRILHLEGTLFFGSSGELQDLLDETMRDPEVQVLVVRLKRTKGLDVTTAGVIRRFVEQLHSQGRHLILVGMRPPMMRALRDLDIEEVIGAQQLYPTRQLWFEALDTAVERALELADTHEDCPLREYLAEQGRRRERDADLKSQPQEPAVEP